jgi:hypothetical protein
MQGVTLALDPDTGDLRFDELAGQFEEAPSVGMEAVKLTVGAVVAILLVCGVRPHTILDALSHRGGALRTGAGAALPVAGALSWHRFFGSLLVLALTFAVVLNGVAIALPLVR